MMGKSVTTVLLLICLIAFTQAVIVDTFYGRIEGYSTADGDVFRGIPYAQAPIGGLRWNATKPKNDFFSLYQAFEDGAACPQICELPPHTCPEKQSEDCLFLNVFTPLGASGKGQNLPVMVYFHGGNYKQGYGGGPLYNGTTIAKNGNVIVVSINYRLGALGYMANAAAGFEGNFGHQDQLAALLWVQANIRSFGGAVDNVTIFGQSAGAGSVAAHLVSPLSKGLFHRALLQSNPFAIPFRDTNSIVSIAGTFAKHAGCAATDKLCHLGLSVEDVLAAQAKAELDLDSFGGGLLNAFLPWTPLVDGKFIPFQPIDAFKRGAYTKVPTILGTTRDEALVFIYEAFQAPISALTYAGVALAIFGLENGPKVLARYPGYTDEKLDNRDQLVVAGTEFIFHCVNRNATRDLLATGHDKNSVFVYEFEHPMSFGKDGWGDAFPECWTKACHAAELPMVWNSAHWLFDYTAEETEMANAIGKYWTNFAWTGNPNVGPKTEVSSAAANNELPEEIRVAMKDIDVSSAPLDILDVKGTVDLPQWAPYSQASGNLIIDVAADGGIRMENNLYNDACNFWDTIGYSK